jgi:hypothetical protein
MVNLRTYQPSDFETLRKWWEARGAFGLKPEFLPETTYILEYEGRPAFSISLVLTNVKGYAYLENFVSDPSLTGDIRKSLSADMVAYAESVAHFMGYERLICIAPNAKLEARYSELGYQVSLPSVSTLVKEI